MSQMGFAFDVGMAPELGAHVSAALVAYAQLLALPAAEIEAAVDEELSRNPALTLRPLRGCHVCCRSSPVQLGCVHCSGGSRQRSPLGEPVHREIPASAEHGADAMVAAAMTVLPARYRALAALVVSHLDDRGMLPGGVEGLAAATSFPRPGIERVIVAIREVGPVGIAAADGRECLLLQLDHLDSMGRGNALARAVVADHLEDLAATRFATIARALGATAEEVVAVRDFIRSHLRPYPVEADGSGQPWAPGGLPPTVVTDVAVLEDPERADRYVVEIVERRRLRLVVDPAYRRLASHPSPDVKAHVRAYTQDAHRFLSRLEQRWRTMQLIAERIVDVQADFFKEGPLALHPLTRAQVAADTGLHESTVSRATAGRHLLTPAGRVVPIADLLTPSGGVREALRRLVAADQRPRSDRELAEELTRQGYPVARRTVAKHRAALRIPDQHRR